jgi:hypothetical protein
MGSKHVAFLLPTKYKIVFDSGLLINELINPVVCLNRTTGQQLREQHNSV